MTRKLLIITGLFGALAVILGAFGAHGLKPQLTEYQIGIFETGNNYHFYHTLAIGLCALISMHHRDKWVKWSAYLFLIGIICFSGSLYLLATRDLLGISHWSWLGPVTPIGGILFILGWIFLIIPGIKNQIK